MKNKRSSKVFGVMKEVHSKTWLMGKERGSRKCKRDCEGVWRKDECWSKKAKETGYGRRKRL